MAKVLITYAMVVQQDYVFFLRLMLPIPCNKRVYWLVGSRTTPSSNPVCFRRRRLSHSTVRMAVASTFYLEEKIEGDKGKAKSNFAEAFK